MRELIDRSILAIKNPLIIFCAIAVLLCAWLPPLDGPAEAQIDNGLKRALVTYGSARALHALVSAAQGTSLTAAPMGVGTTLTVGQVLAPVAEMLKQFSDLMLLVCVSFGIQKILIAVGGFWVVSLSLSMVTVAWAYRFWRKLPQLAWLNKALIVLLLVRFAVPVTILATDIVYQGVLSPTYTESQNAIEAVSKDTDKPDANVTSDTPEDANADAPGMLERLKEWAKKKIATPNQKFENLKTTVSQAFKHMIQLMAIFVIQTIIMPLLFLLALYSAIKAMLGAPALNPVGRSDVIET